MEGVVVLLLIYIILFSLFVYIMICGNTRYHRNGIIGALYRFITQKMFCCKSKNQSLSEGCLGPGGPCRYFVAIFFYCIYTYFALVYLFWVYPSLDILYKNVQFHRFFSIWVLPWTWVCFIIFQFADPGVINRRNVIAYLKKYHYDGVLYTPDLCRTLHIPIVPRSRFDRYTKKRIAYVFIFCILNCNNEREISEINNFCAKS